MEEPRLAYRVRTADPADDAALKASIGTTLAHPDQDGKRGSYRGAAGRGDLLVLERYDRQERTWRIAGFVEYRMRVDDLLSLHDMGTAESEPQAAVVRYLLDQLFGSLNPVAAQIKIRRDAREWLDIIEAIPGFYREGEEYRRPHYWAIFRWDAERAREAQRREVPRGRSAARPPLRPGGSPQRPGSAPRR